MSLGLGLYLSRRLKTLKRYLLNVFTGAAAAYSLRKLEKDATYAVRVRRSTDNSELDIGFDKDDQLDTTALLDFVNVRNEYPADYDTGAAAAYSLRYVSDSYTGDVVRVRRSVDNAEADFNPTEITDGTLLSWVNGVNLLLFSEQFDNPYYTANLGTITSNQTTAPDGSLTADLFTKTSGVNTVSELRRNLNYSSTGIHTYSIYVKQNVGDDVLLRLDAGGNTANASFKFSTKTISSFGANAISATATELSDGWFRLTLTGNVTSINFLLSIVNLFVNASNDSVYIWGAQLELGSTATTYTETTDAPAGYGYVTTWYDQSGNSNDATQGTAASQPKIVDAGVLVEENGRPAVDFDGTDDFLGTTSVSLNTNDVLLSTVLKSNSSGSIRTFFSYGGYISNGFIFQQANTGSGNLLRYAVNGTGFEDYQAFNSSNGQSLVILQDESSGDADVYLDGVSGTPKTISASINASLNIAIGRREDLSTQYWSGNIQELILYPSDQSANRGNIEANVNDYYSIYTSTNDGFVTTWYDQAGSNDATQATAASQPQIVDGGSLITSNGYQVIQYDGTDDNLTTSLTATGTMLMGGSDGSAFYEVAISGSYSLLSSANNTKHPLNESIRVIWGSSLTTAQKTAIEAAVTYSDWDFSDITSFENYWRLRSELTDFPLIDVNNGSSFRFAWFGCSSLTSFPALDVSSGTNFFRAWNVCSSLQDFPANMFDSVTATDFSLAFSSTNLTQTSIDNILVSIDTAGQSGGTFTQSGGSAPSAIGEAAIDNLTARGWNITVTGGYVSPYIVDAYSGSAAAYSLRDLSLNTTNVVRVRREIDNAERDFTSTEITDGTLLSWVGNTATDYGYVTTWYDQSGNGNHASQGSGSSQPQIVDGGSLITQGGKASIDFGTISENKCLTVNTSSITNNLITIVHNITYKINKVQVLLALSNSNYIIISAVDAGKLKYENSNDDMISTTNVGSFQLSTIDINDGKLYTNNLEEDNVTTASGATSRYVIGNYTSISGNELEGYVSEIVTWQTAQTSNRASIEGNINGHYNIYP